MAIGGMNPGLAHLGSAENHPMEPQGVIGRFPTAGKGPSWQGSGMGVEAHQLDNEGGTPLESSRTSEEASANLSSRTSSPRSTLGTFVSSAVRSTSLQNSSFLHS